MLPQLESESLGLKPCLLTDVAEESRCSVGKNQAPCPLGRCPLGRSRSSYTETAQVEGRTRWDMALPTQPPLLLSWGGGQLAPPDLSAAGTPNVDHISHRGALTGGWRKEPIFLLLDHFLLPRKLHGRDAPQPGCCVHVLVRGACGVGFVMEATAGTSSLRLSPALRVERPRCGPEVRRLPHPGRVLDPGVLGAPDPPFS